ncbi:MAG: Fic family protein [Desulfobulbaceae bacterium]|jgi:Fic family protein|nr:Fic family protein [Desulfobulbaceae bacterium]
MTKKPCIPDKLPLHELDWQRLASFTSKATMAVARYDGTLAGMVNAAVLLSPITRREAVLSSRIEGTQASMVEVLKHEAGEEYSENKKGDINEVMNYRKALLLGEDSLAERPISLQLIRELHSLLMQGVRGGDKTPGSFRTEQNWIGKKGTPIEEARFIPPDPLLMQDAMINLEEYINFDDIDPLVQLAILHAQFEIIHPFVDGNGRLGRMLIPLFLYQKNVLQRPMFYLSEYLDEADEEYRGRLLAITDDNDWQGWIEFFLLALQHQAARNTEKAKSIHKLYEEMKVLFVGITHSQYAQTTLDAFFNKPILNSSDFLKITEINNRGTANTILRALVHEEVISVLREGSGQSPAIYCFPSLINISEGQDVI